MSLLKNRGERLERIREFFETAFFLLMSAAAVKILPISITGGILVFSFLWVKFSWISGEGGEDQYSLDNYDQSPLGKIDIEEALRAPCWCASGKKTSDCCGPLTKCTPPR